MADVFDELGEQKEQPQTAPKTAGRTVASPSQSDVFDEAAKAMQSPESQDAALKRIENQSGDKWYQQRVGVSADADPVSRFAGNIVGNPSFEDLGQGAKQVVRHPIDSARMLLESSGEAQRGLWNRAKKEWQYPGIGGKADAAAHALESAVPFVGPSLARIGDQFASGDVAGGAGGITGLTAGALVAPEARETATAPVRAIGRLASGRTGSRLLGGAGGAAVGEAVEHPYIGWLAGERLLGPSVRYYGTKLSRLGLERGPRPLFDLSTGEPPSMVTGALSRSNPASPNPRVLARGGGIRTTPIAALPAHAGENAELAIGERPTEYAPIYNTPHPLSGEGALRQVLTGQDNKALLQIARARGIDVAKEAQLKPGIADAKLINKIIDDFSPDELDEIRARYLENTRHGARLGDIGPEAWKTLSLQSYFPDLKISQARLARTRAAIERARPQPAPPMGVPGEPTDLTPLLEKSLRRVRQQRASSAAAND